MKKSVILFVTIFLCGMAIAVPDLSGTWKLDLSQSDFGVFPPPSAVT